MDSAVELLHEIPVLRLRGEIDIATASAFRQAIEDITGQGHPLVVVDLSEVAFFDSSGLKVLDDAQHVAAANGARLALACPPGRVLRLFEITGLDDRFTIHPDAEDAATTRGDTA